MEISLYVDFDEINNIDIVLIVFKDFMDILNYKCNFNG